MTHRRNPLSRAGRSISRKNARRDSRLRTGSAQRRSTTDTSRRLQHQTLERRELLAAEIISGPRLVSVEAGAVSQIRLDGTSVENRLDSAPRELTFRFDGTSQLDGNTLQGIRVIGSGGDGTFDDGNEVLIQPGFLGFADDEVGDRVVVSRFVEALPDDRYRIQIAGYDDVNNQDVFANGDSVDTNITALRDTDGNPILPADQVSSATPSLNIDFEVEVGAQVVAVVPQPISGTAGNRVQARNEIHVYFNEDPLSNPNAGVITNNPNPPSGQTLSGLPVVRPEFYQLFMTKDTVDNTDDLRLEPETVIYDPTQSMAVLQFTDDLSVLTGRTDGVGTFRLRVGSGDSLPDAPTLYNLAAEGASVVDASGNPINVPFNDTFAGSDIFVNDANAGQSPEKAIHFSPSDGLQSVLLRGGSIENTGAYVPPWPGAYDAPGSRDQRRDASVVGRIDTNTGINIFPYNFAKLYGEDPNGNPLDNAITTAQQQRTREILDLYEEHLGVRFVETSDSGLQIVTGDLRAIQETADTGAGEGTPYSLYRVNERDPSRGVLVLEADEGWYDGYGLSPDSRPSWFVEGLRGIGNLLGVGDLFELPDGVAAGGSSPDEPNSETQSNDGDGGPSGVAGFPTLPSEPDFLSQSDITLGQSLHRPESSDVDLYSFTIDPPIDDNIADDAVLGRLSLETFAQRLDDVSLLDTLVQLYRVTPGPGGTSNYELIARNDDSFGDDSHLQVDLAAGDYIVGVTSTGNDAYSGTSEDTGNGGRTEGNYELRMTFDSSFGAASGDALVDANGTRLDGDADGAAGGDFNFWFRTAPATTNASEVRTIFVTKDSDGSDSNNGSLDSPYGTVSKALSESKPGDIVRLLPSAGLDGQVTAVDDPNTAVNEAFEAQKDNRAYEFGRGGTNNSVLADGATFDVPRGVTVMIDAGALLKLQDAKIGVGSESIDPNRELAALQVLGTPTSSVVFTSYNDQNVGIDTNPINTTPGSGDWAGIDLRNDVDYAEGREVWERQGIFLDYVSHTELRYGGGRAGLRADVVAPIQMSESRPTLINNTISFSAGAAMSADPNSFREDNFNTSLYQNAGLFTSDYDRVGPEISGNVLVENTTNGLFIRVTTPAGGELETLTQSARFDDTDVVHVISQALTIAGAPGGPVLLEDRPSVGSVTLTPSTTGDLAAGQHEYVLSFVTREGHESLVSLPTSSVTVTDAVDSSGSVTLRNLPTAPAEYIGRKLYRGTLVAGVIEYELVDQLDRRTSTYVDSGQTQSGSPSIQAVPEATAITVTGLNGQGEFNENQSIDYRITFADAYGGETRASNATTTVVTGQDAAIEIANIPVAPEGFIGTNVYRRDPSSGDYFLVAELRHGETSLLDDARDQSVDGSLLGRKLGADADGGSKLLARFDARLTIDPGTIVKLGTARIEATFGADFYAEGTEGSPIVFTSQSDDEYGVGGTFDTNNDGVSEGEAGDWGGIELRQGVTASLDHVDVRYGGGEAPVQGGLTKFNALEILQADVRVVNSSFVSNADGKDVDGIGADSGSFATRVGRGFNDAATIFVRGAQPILIGNTIVDGDGAAISINPDALTFEAVTDPGRSTGMIDRFVDRPDNQGPLLLDNKLAGNDLNGMRVRSEIVTTDSVWDDTDIVHVVEGSIYSMTQHYYGAIRLRSDADQSLVVKFTEDGSLVGGGRPLDIIDRIGGTLQVLGSPGFPVVLTSINDSTIGAGFTPDGRSQRDTNNTGLPVDANGNEINTASAGDWEGLQLLSYINDRNVAYVYENERGDAGAITTNRDPVDAQILGALATGETTGDDNERLGFTIRGTLATQDDIDTYRFSAAGGTAVYFDIDETSPGLDTVVELVNDSGVVIASSDNSFAEANGRETIYVNTALQNGVLESDVRALSTGLTSGNVESSNTLDAGFRVILPGNFDAKNDYYVRVHSANAETSGQYELGIRLQEADEVAGSTVRGADIRYATNAIAVSGTPMHSPLVGDVGESVVYVDPTPGDQNSGDESTRETVDTRLSADPADAQDLGNLLTSDRGALTVTGELGNLSNTSLDIRLEDVDVYRVELRAQQLKPDTFDSENRFVSATFDIDYADQLARANTVLSVYDSEGRLILVGRDSNVTDDQGRPLEGVDMSNLAAGSAGTLDAFIGPVELPEGVYYVAVSSEAAVPAVLNQFFEANPVNPDVRLMPVNSVRRVSRDDLDESGFFSSRWDDYTAERPVIEPAFGDDSPIAYTLDDIRLFVNLIGGTGSNDSTLASFNPFTGTVERSIGSYGPRTRDIAIRSDGELMTYNLPPNNPSNGNTGNFLNVSPADSAVTQAGDDGIEFRQTNEAGNNTEVDGNAQYIVNAMTFERSDSSAQDGSVNRSEINNNNERFWVVGNRDSGGRNGVPVELRTNILYQAAGGTGEITSRGSLNGDADNNYSATVPYQTTMGPASDEREYGIVDTGFIETANGGDGGDITGLAALNNNLNGDLIAVTDLGGVHVFDPDQTEDAPEGFFDDGYSRVIPTTKYGYLTADPNHVADPGSNLGTDPSTGEQYPLFTGLSLGPQVVENRAYADMLFATTVDGWLYAFTLGTDQAGMPTTEPANVFYNGGSAVQLRFLGDQPGFDSGINYQTSGLAFSNLEVNPWHTTNDRSGDAGHGDVVPYDSSRLNTTGGSSLYFGFEIDNNADNNTIARPEGSNLGQIAPGGSHGSAISDFIDLSEYSAGDKPTLYFTYNIDVEDDDDYRLNRAQHDSFRVFASGDDGEWHLLATNDEFRELPNNDEYDEYVNSGIAVQTIFDDNAADQWRQVRVDLSPLAGSSNARIRFDFSTAGSMRTQFGSVELVGVAGEQLVDNDITEIENGSGNFAGSISSLQTVVGRDVKLPSGADLVAGDSFQVTYLDPAASPQQRTVNVTFVDTLTPGAADVEVLIDPAATASEVATAVAAAVPGPMRPRVDDNGRLSLLAATNIQVDGQLAGGQANPVEFSGSFQQLLVPSGDEAAVGERVTINLPSEPAATLRYVRTIDPADTSGDVQIVALSGESRAQIATRIAAALPAGATFVNADGNLNFLQAGVAINVQAAASQIVITNLDPANTPALIEVPAGADLRSGEGIFLDADGAPGVTVRFVRQGSDLPSGNHVSVYFTESMTAADVSALVVTKLQSVAPGLVAVESTTTDGFEITGANPVANVLANQPTITSQDSEVVDTYGVPVTLPAASDLTDGESITVFRKDAPLAATGSTYTFRTATTGAANEIVYSATDTPQEIAEKFLAALDPALAPQMFGSSGREVLIVEAASISVADSASKIVSWEATRQSGFQYVPRAVPVITNAVMDASEVAEQLQSALVASLGTIAAQNAGYRTTADTSNYKISGGNRVRIYLPESGDSPVLDPGPYGLNMELPGDEFGLGTPNNFNSSQSAGASNNEVAGVYIDDIIIGMAERGEAVLYENYSGQPGNSDFVLDPSYLPDTRGDAVQPEHADEILVGGYSLGIRMSDEYAVPQDYNPINLELDEQRSLGRSFDSNDRLVDGAVTIVAPAGRNLLDGDTFVLDDGSYRLTFEFDSRYATGVTPDSGHVPVPFDPADTEAQVAASIRDAINSSQAQDTLAISAATGDSSDSGTSTSSRVELFGNSYVLDDNLQRRPVSVDIVVNPGSQRTLKLDLNAEETFKGRYTSRRVAIVDHDNANTSTATEYVIYDDELAQSAVPGYVSGDTLFATGKIGDAVNIGILSGSDADDGAVLASDPTFDLDSVRVYLEAGEGIDIDLDTTGLFKVGAGLQRPFIAIVEQGTKFTSTELNFAFAQDGSGNPAFSGFNSPTLAVGETEEGATLQFTPTRSGYYDVIISSAGAYAGGGFPSGNDMQLGDYFMSIRPTGDPGVPERDVLMVDYHFGITDQNSVDDQGQLIIADNFIRDSANVGISTIVDADSGKVGNSSSLPGSAQLLRNVNQFGLVPGAVIVNNVVERSGSIGIEIGGGDYGNGEQGTPSLFSRVINNTIVNEGNGVGISVSGRAAPTLLNNVIVGAGNGIDVDTQTASGTRTGSNLFANNGTNSTLPIANSSIELGTNVDLADIFQDASRSIYIPAAGSSLIDNSIDSLDDRSDFANTVKGPVGLPPSPILAPSVDIYGQRRVDGIAGTPGGGTGSNVFIDRGAVDRADVRRPNAVLNNPFDAPNLDAAGSPTDPNTVGDTDPEQSFVRLVNSDQFVNFFEIQLIDEAGTGLDASTITADTVLLTENGRQLLPGRDFTFGYSENSRTIRLTPLAGVWNQDSVYEVTLNNQVRRVVELPSGGSIADGDQVVVTDDTGRESVFEFDSGYTLGVPQNETLVVTDTKAGFRDTDTFTITSVDGSQSVTFEINTTGAVASANVAIPLAATGTVTEIRDAILRVLDPTQFAGSPASAVDYADLLGLAPVAVGNDSIQLGTLPGHDVDISNVSSGLTESGAIESVVDGQQFTYTRGAQTVTFELDSDGSFDPADQTQTLRRVGFDRTDTPDEIASSIATALRDSNLNLSDAVAIGDGLVSVGGLVGDTVELDDSSLSLTGNPGVTGGLQITIPDTETGTSIDGSTVTIDVAGTSETFEFTTDPQLTSANVTVVVAADADPTAIATALESAIELALGSTLQNVTRDGSVITLGETATDFTTVDVVDGPAVVAADALVIDGVSGGAFAVEYTPSDSFPAVSVATKLQQAIDDAGVNVDVFSPGGGVLLFAGTQNVVSRGGVDDAGTVAPTIAAVSDLAGNPVSPTRPNNETRFTIIMPDVRFDFGDAPASYGTFLQSPTPNLQPTDPNYVPGNGARHAITGGTEGSRLGFQVDTESDGQPVDSGVGVSDDQLQSVGAAATAADLITPNLARITITRVPRSGDLLTLSVGGTDYAFQFISDGTTAVPPRITIPIAAGDRTSDVAATLLAALNANVTGVTATIDPDHPEQIEIDSTAGGAPGPELMVGSQSSLFSPAFTVDDSDPHSLSVTFTDVPSPGQLIDLRTDDQTLTYEFVNPTSNPRPGSIPVLITGAFTTEQVAEALLATIRPNLSTLGGSILADIDESDGSSVLLTAIDDEDGVSVVTFNQGGGVAPAYFFGRYADNGATFDASQADQVFGFLNPADPAGTNVEVYVTGGGLVDAWIDFNGNGVFDEDGSEQVLKNTPVVDGINTLSIVTPSTVTDKDTWLRIRLSDSGNTRPTGVTIGGEVEDYQVSVRSVPLPVPSGDGDQFIAVEDTPLRIDSSLSAADPPLDINAKTLFTNDNFASQILPVRYFVDLPRIFVEPDQTSYPGDDVLVYQTPAGGILEVNRTMQGSTPGDDLTGSFLYTPPEDFNGVDTFRYRLSTQQNADSQNLDGITFETVTINVLPDNDDPGASDETFVTFEPTRDGGDATLVITADDLVASAIPDYDPNQSNAPLDESNQTILVRSVTTASGSITAGGSGDTIMTPQGGTLVAEFNDAANPQWITRLLYTPADDFNSDVGAVGDLLLDEFTFTLFDDGISQLPSDLETNLADLEADGLLGSDDLSADPYYIDGGERDQFLRKAVTASEATATVTIRVVPRNDAPVPVADYVGLTDATGAPNDRYLNFFSDPATRPTPTEDTTLVFSAAYLLDNDAAGPAGAVDETDPLNGNDGDIRVVAVGLDDANANTLSRGSISLDPDTGMITFTPADDIYGEITFTYTVMDSGIDEGLDVDDVFDANDRGTRDVNGRTSTITSTIFVAPVNDAPVAYDRLARMTESTTDNPTSISIDADDLITANLPASTSVDSNIVVTSNAVILPDADELFDGETLVFTAANGRRAAIALNTTGVVPAGVDRVVRYSPSDVAADLATSLEQAMRAIGFGGTAAGDQVDFSDANIITEVPRTNSLTVDSARQAIAIPSGADLGDGEQVEVVDLNGDTYLFEFTTTGNVDADAVPVAITVADTSEQIAEALAAAMTTEGLTAVAAATAQTQVRVHFDDAASIDPQAATSAIRVIGSDVIMPAGSMLQNGELLEIENAAGDMTIVEFGLGSDASDSAYVFVPFQTSDTAVDLSARLADAINATDAPNPAAVSANVVTMELWEVTLTDVTTISLDETASGIQIDGSNVLVPAGTELIDGQRIEIADASGNATIVEFNTSGTPSIGADLAVAFSSASSASEVAVALQEQLRLVGLGAIADVGAFGVPADFTRVSLQVINQAGVGELPDAPGDFDSRLPAPFNESEQTPGLRIIEVGTAAGTLNLQTDTNLVSADPNLIGTLTPLGPNEAGLESDSGGIFRFEISTEVVNGETLRYFSNIYYTPPLNYNEQLPFAPNELLTYKIIDDGLTTIPSPASVQNLPPEVSESGTLTITVAAANDVPTFDGQMFVNVLERDDLSSTTIPDFVSQIFAGPDDAFDEVQTQEVDFLDPELVSGDPSVMDAMPVINYTPGSTEGSLTVFPAPDQVGELVYRIVAFEVDDPTSLSEPQLVTINVRPVNDRPRIDPTIAGTTDSANADEAYSVTTGSDTDNDGFNDQATIRYTLREDNTRPDPSQPGEVLTGSYFIPVDKNIALPSDVSGTVTVGDYTRLGLLDVYNVGPANETVDGTDDQPTGGPQVLELFDFPDTTKLGGTLARQFSTTEVDASGNPLLIGLLYTPPTDFNNFNGSVDSFEYTVRDDNPSGGETYSLETESLIQDRLTSTSVVELNLNPVNDRPEFSTLDLQYEVAEDGPEQVINGFAFGISAGPAQSAFDEINSGSGQDLSFSISSLSFDDADAAEYFDQMPTVDLQGQLRYKPAADVYGTFEFSILLQDDGSDDASRGDLNTSIPATLTIDVRPVNDRPAIAPEFDTPATNPLSFDISEGGSMNVLVNGDGTSPGLLDVFVVGPDNEAADIVPGGNQSLSLTQPIPVTTAQGGTLELVTPATGSPYFRYTPRDNYVGPDNFNYTVTDDGVTVPLGTGGVANSDPQIATGTVTFNVLPVNDAPQFSGAGDVTSNEDANSGAGRGVVTIENWATNVQAGPPGADDEIGPPGQPLDFEILAIGGDEDLFTVAPHAIIEDGGTASLNYTLAPNANGAATFTVQLFDGGPDNLGNGDINESDVRTFTVNVTPVNDAPAFVPGGEVTVFEDRGPYSSTWATSISPGPADESSQGVSFSVTPVSASDAALFSSNGQPQISSSGVLAFTPAPNANGTAQVRVVATDSEGAQSAAVTLDIVVLPVNDFPVPVGDQLDPTTEDAVLTIPASQLLANDVDPDLGDTPPDELQLSMPLVQRSLRGAIVRFDPATGIVTYDPSESRELQALRPDSPALADSFSYAVTDIEGRSVTPNRVSNSVLVTVNVSGVNDAPIVEDDTPTLSPSGPTTIDVLANDEDIDGTIDPSTVTITSQPAFGSVTVNPDTGAIVYTPFTGFPGKDEFRYTVEDDFGAISEEGRVEISPNTAPIVRDDTGVAYTGESIIIRILDNDQDTDPDDDFDLASVQIESGPSAGTVTTLPDGTVRYTPTVGFTGRDSFDYSVADTRGRRSGLATVSIQVVASRLQNPDTRYDVNDDGAVSALDALLIINFLNRNSDAVALGATIPPAENLVVEIDDPVPPDSYLSSDGHEYGAGYFDVSGNRVISELDVLQIINELNRRDTTGGSAEPIPAAASAAPVGNVPAPVVSESSAADAVATVAVEVFDSEDEWVDSTASTQVETDVLDRLVAAQQTDDDEDEEKDQSSAIDIAMSRLL
ncbi:tandem-95 repeat protein [Allorhodopirellula solitaria]|uniref:Cadherin domain-containing protein n=1 Tax=Allorhodopirellula solitaria TaxID=2527987 RepID=A0A5C5YH56_9BACT|nr:tandem-95 repeat protein [Allorhodopirellula solitaria]TWT73865.1 hypothetical protein CA85_07470 [Allorhodopirellula solitaria]